MIGVVKLHPLCGDLVNQFGAVFRAQKEAGFSEHMLNGYQSALEAIEPLYGSAMVFVAPVKQCYQ
jgi:hypothetical protein